MPKLTKDFYERENVVEIARDLIGKVLYTNFEEGVSAGIIVETEAYNGRNDKACHAFGKRTKRTEVMYGPGGTAYVYLCYGIHHLFNIVTNIKGQADAVLIRAIEPLSGIELMESRRNMKRSKTAMTSGPGVVSKALGIGMSHYGVDLSGDSIWLEEENLSDFQVEARKRVGVDYAEEDALLPWRMIMKDNKWVSRLDIK